MILSEGMYDVPAGQVVAVVTYLEMTAPAVTQAKPLPTGVSIAHETLSLDAYRSLFRAVGAPWLWTSRLAMDDASLSAVLSVATTETWVVRHNGDAIGLIELDFADPQTSELAFFGIVPNATGKGLGGPMMALAQREAFRDTRGKFTVHTCSLDDPRALAFYRKAGFTPVKRGVEVFADPRLNGPHDATTAPQIPCLT